MSISIIHNSHTHIYLFYWTQWILHNEHEIHTNWLQWIWNGIIECHSIDPKECWIDHNYTDNINNNKMNWWHAKTKPIGQNKMIIKIIQTIIDKCLYFHQKRSTTIQNVDQSFTYLLLLSRNHDSSIAFIANISHSRGWSRSDGRINEWRGPPKRSSLPANCRRLPAAIFSESVPTRARPTARLSGEYAKGDNKINELM